MKSEIDGNVVLHCINVMCVNQVPGLNYCNLKRTIIDSNGKCVGFVKGENEKKKTVKRKSGKNKVASVGS